MNVRRTTSFLLKFACFLAAGLLLTAIPALARSHGGHISSSGGASVPASPGVRLIGRIMAGLIVAIVTASFAWFIRLSIRSRRRRPGRSRPPRDDERWKP